MIYQSHNPEETAKIAADLASRLKGGQVVGLKGNLGAGKTVFAKALAKELGVAETVTSPTFVIMKIYPAKTEGMSRLLHIDAYRLESAADLEAIGWRQYLDEQTVAIVEWAEKVEDSLPDKFVRVEIKGAGEEVREIEINN